MSLVKVQIKEYEEKLKFREEEKQKSTFSEEEKWEKWPKKNSKFLKDKEVKVKKKFNPFSSMRKTKNYEGGNSSSKWKYG